MADDHDREPLLDGVDGPRPLRPGTRASLEAELSAGSDSMDADDPTAELPAVVVERMEAALVADAQQRADAVADDERVGAAALAGIDGARAVPAPAVARVERALVEAGQSRRQAARRRWLAVAAAALIVTGSAVAIGVRDGRRASSKSATVAAGAGQTSGTTGVGAGQQAGVSDQAGGAGATAGGSAAQGPGVQTAPPSTAITAMPTASGSGSAATGTGGATTNGPATAPVVSGVSPSKGPVAGGTQVTISGRDLQKVTAVLFGSAAAQSFRVRDDTTIVAVTPAAAKAGAVPVTVRTGSTSSTSSSGAAFQYVNPPSVRSIAPVFGPTGGGNTVTISGTGFTDASAVFFGSVRATEVIVDSDGQIRAVAPPHSAGSVDVTVTGPGGTSPPGPLTRYTFGP